MGCATVKEKIESQMMILKLKRVDIIQEREAKLKELERLTGETMKRKPIPDYLIRDLPPNKKRKNNNDNQNDNNDDNKDEDKSNNKNEEEEDNEESNEIGDSSESVSNSLSSEKSHSENSQNNEDY